MLFYCYGFLACQNTKIGEDRSYLFLGHSYQWGVKDNNKIDHRIEKYNFSTYDGIWLGGDLCARTSENPATIDYLDTLLHLSRPTTHWALGNHDLVEGDVRRIEAKTQRRSFYASSFDGMTLLVLNTNLFGLGFSALECSEVSAQYALIKAVTDTIQHASHLVVLHHHCLLTNSLTNNELDMAKIFHQYQPDYKINCVAKEDTVSNFEKLAYPAFQKVQQRGVQVVFVGGDIGMRVKEFAYKTQEGLQFLGSGINNSCDKNFAPAYVTNFDPDQLLIFHRNTRLRTLSWQFIKL